MTRILVRYLSVFFFNDTATTEIYTLSLHDALPISNRVHGRRIQQPRAAHGCNRNNSSRSPHASAQLYASLDAAWGEREERSEEHTSELQSHLNLVCRLLLEKKKKKKL